MNRLLSLIVWILSTTASAQPSMLPDASRVSVSSILKHNRHQIILVLNAFNKETERQSLHHKADEFNYEHFNQFVLELHPALIYYTLQYLALKYPEAGEPVRRYLSESSIKQSLKEYMNADKASAKEITKFRSQVKTFKRMSNKNFLKFVDKIIDDLTSVEA